MECGGCTLYGAVVYNIRHISGSIVRVSLYAYSIL